MNRRNFMAAGIAGTLAGALKAEPAGAAEPLHPGSDEIRSLFPGLREGVFLNAAGGTPLGTFAREGLRRYQEYWELGPSAGREQYPAQVQSEVRAVFARLIGADEDEIGLVHCTKAGEQIVLDSLPALQNGGNVVSNDLHFSGSLHNLVGLKKAGKDIRIVRNRDWRVTPESMESAMDSRTALLAITLLSNVNGHLEDIRRLADGVHARGGYLYADIIQAAGIYPLNMREMGIDFAACSGYKWLFGPHGCGFFFVRRELQGEVLPDHLFPGRSQPNYPPFVEAAAGNEEEYSFSAPADARRYQAGHVSYLGYCALYEGMRFLERVGIERALQHSLGLNRILKESLDAKQFPCLSPDWEASPIITFGHGNAGAVAGRLQSAGVTVTVSGNRIRVSPAAYNNREDVERLIRALRST